MTDIVISGTGLYTPPERISNDELVESFNSLCNRPLTTSTLPILRGISHRAATVLLGRFCRKSIGHQIALCRRYKQEFWILSDLHHDIAETPNEAQSVQCEMAVAAAREAMDQAGKSAGDIDAVIVAASNMQRAYPPWR